MLGIGIITIILASLLHCWYVANKAAAPSNCAGGFLGFGTAALAVSILLLIVGTGMIWVASSIWAAVAAIAAYFFILPLIFLPIMQRIYLPMPRGKVGNAEWAQIAGLDQPVLSTPRANDFGTQLFLWLQEATDQGEGHIDVIAGELHRRVGHYPGPQHRMPICCRVMKEEMQAGDVVLEEPPKGSGAALTIRYLLPRQSTQTISESLQDVR